MLCFYSTQLPTLRSPLCVFPVSFPFLCLFIIGLYLWHSWPHRGCVLHKHTSLLFKTLKHIESPLHNHFISGLKKKQQQKYPWDIYVCFWQLLETDHSHNWCRLCGWGKKTMPLITLWENVSLNDRNQNLICHFNSRSKSRDIRPTPMYGLIVWKITT